MGDAVRLRQQAYLDLLDRGLVLLRNFAHSGDVELCRIEADHLHNIPNLLHEDNERRHEYYIRGERGLYLHRLRARGAAEYLAQAAIWYTEPWRVLARAAGVPLSDPRATAEHERWAASVAAQAVEALRDAGLLVPPEAFEAAKLIVAKKIFERLGSTDDSPSLELDQAGPGGDASKPEADVPV
jgi:hypothetical protein